MCRGGYWLNEAPRLTAYGGLQRIGHTGPDEALQVLPRRFVRQEGDTGGQGVVKPPPQRHSIAVRYPSARAGRDGADYLSGNPAGAGAGRSPGCRRSSDLARPEAEPPRGRPRPQWSRTGLLLILLPGRTVSALLPTAGTRKHRAEL